MLLKILEARGRLAKVPRAWLLSRQDRLSGIAALVFLPLAPPAARTHACAAETAHRVEVICPLSAFVAYLLLRF